VKRLNSIPKLWGCVVVIYLIYKEKIQKSLTFWNYDHPAKTDHFLWNEAPKSGSFCRV